MYEALEWLHSTVHFSRRTAPVELKVSLQQKVKNIQWESRQMGMEEENLLHCSSTTPMQTDETQENEENIFTNLTTYMQNILGKKTEKT